MTGFIEVLFDPSLQFLSNGLIAGLLSSILFGIIGAIVTVKRITGLAGAISHAVLGGVGMALFFSVSGIITWITPIMGAFIFAVIAAVIIGIVSLKLKQREDTVINAIWAIGMSIGVLFMARTPGYTDPMSYLFGNILFISKLDLYLLAAMDIIVISLVWRFYPQIEASAFDDEFARVRGVKTEILFLVLLIIIAVSIVLLQTFVGIVMVIAMLTLPAGTAGYAARNLADMMVLGSIFSAIFTVSGLYASWLLDTPSGAMTVVFAGAVFLSSAVIRLIISRLKK